MSSKFKVNGISLDDLCEVRRDSTSAKLGGGTNRYIDEHGDLYNRYASYPSGYKYAKYAFDENEGFYLSDGNKNIPSALGYRPQQKNIIDLTTVGTWYLWRNGTNIKLRNPSGSESTYSSATFGLPYAPKILAFEMVAGGSGGAGGDGSAGGCGGGGGGFVAGFVEVPEASSYSGGVVLIVGKGGAGGPGGTFQTGRSEAGGHSSIGGRYAWGGDPAVNGSSISDVGKGGGYQFTSTYVLKSQYGADGGRGNGYKGGDVSGNYNLSPEKNISYSFSGGSAPATPGGGGASAAGPGGKGGDSFAEGNAPSSGYGGGGGGGNWVVFDGKKGGNGRAGRIRLFY